VGTLLYTILCGYPPFNGKNTQLILKAVSEAKILFHVEDWSNTSNSAKDLIERMIKKNVSKRITISESLTH
jgi:calcium-dependent protein kinase